eukprot:gene9103-10674_t
MSSNTTTTKKNSGGSDIPKGKDREDKDALREKIAEHFEDYKQRKLEHVNAEHKCRNCWFLIQNCTCRALTPVKLRHRYVTLFHHKEWTRASNTGKLITLASNKDHLLANRPESEAKIKYIGDNAVDLLDFNNGNESSKLLVMNLEDDEKHLAHILETTDHANMFVLFPFTDSIDINEFLKRHVANNSNAVADGQQKPEESIPTTTTTETTTKDPITVSITETLESITLDDNIDRIPQLTVIVLDGTWSQAKKLHKKLPADIQRVHLSFGDKRVKSMYNALRKQPQIDRISTLEASTMVMKHIGETDAACNSLIAALQKLIETLLRQNGATESRKTWVGDDPYFKDKRNQQQW